MIAFLTVHISHLAKKGITNNSTAKHFEENGKKNSLKLKKKNSSSDSRKLTKIIHMKKDYLVENFFPRR